MKILDIIPGWAWAAALVAALALAGFLALDAAASAVDASQARMELADEREAQSRADLQQADANARETLRRLNKQQENQDAQDRLLVAARADAARAADDAERLRQQNADVAQRWRDALRNPAAAGQCPAAGDAIVLSTELFSRIDRRAGELAAYADAARIAGLKCEADYDALTPQLSPARAPSLDRSAP